MSSVPLVSGPYKDLEIIRRIQGCPQLGSLRSISNALSTLLTAETSYIHEIAEIIRRDPTLTTRLLRLVNSVFFGLSQRVTKIEDAIFYLGVRQVRELALAMPIIEDFADISHKKFTVDWGDFWRHSIGCAMVTRELIEVVNISSLDETDYIVGLVHDVGKLVMASIFPQEFAIIIEQSLGAIKDVVAKEKELIGWDHAEIGALFLERHQLPARVVEAVKYHNNPHLAPKYSKISAALQVADHMVRHVGVRGIEVLDESFEDNCWVQLPGWKVLFPSESTEYAFGIASLRHSLRNLPRALQGMVERGCV